MSEQKSERQSEPQLPRLGEPGAPTKEEAEAFAVSAVAYILRQVMAREQFPIVLISVDLDAGGRNVSVWPVMPGQDHAQLARLLREAGEHMGEDKVPTETLSGEEVVRGFADFLARAEAERKGGGRANQ